MAKKIKKEEVETKPVPPALKMLRAHGLTRNKEGWFLYEVTFQGDKLMPPKVLHGPDRKIDCLMRMEALWSRDE